MYDPAARPVMVWLPLEAALFRLLPVTATEVAFAADQEIVVEPGAVAEFGVALIDALTDAAAVTFTVADCVTGPPLPWAVMVKVCVPIARPLTGWLSLTDVLLSPGPLTATEVALTLDHVIVAEPGAVVFDGLALIDADTLAAAATATVCVIVADVAPPESTALAVNVTAAGPESDVLLPESLSVPLPPPAKAKPTPFFHTLTCVRLPLLSWPCAEIE